MRVVGGMRRCGRGRKEEETRVEATSTKGVHDGQGSEVYPATRGHRERVLSCGGVMYTVPAMLVMIMTICGMDGGDPTLQYQTLVLESWTADVGGPA